jgi:hypothetical protein
MVRPGPGETEMLKAIGQFLRKLAKLKVKVHISLEISF